MYKTERRHQAVGQQVRNMTYYGNHRCVEWVSIWASLPGPLSFAYVIIFLSHTVLSQVLDCSHCTLCNTSSMADISVRRSLFDRGKALDIDLRRKIIQDIIEGGDFVTGFFPGSFSSTEGKNRVKYDTV